MASEQMRTTSRREAPGSTPVCLSTHVNFILGHAADPYHRIDIRQASRNLAVRQGDRVIADTKRPLALYESGFAPRWYVPRDDVGESALTPVKLQTFCPYKGLRSYYSVGDARQAAWSYPDAYPEVRRISNMVSFEPAIVIVHLDGIQLRLEPGQVVVPHGPDRNLDLAELDRAAALTAVMTGLPITVVAIIVAAIGSRLGRRRWWART
jgi:uncharacterized protein (DUF427 family)